MELELELELQLHGELVLLPIQQRPRCLRGRETNKYVRHVTDFVGKINDLTNMSASPCTVVA